jgi:hypothetical protein
VGLNLGISVWTVLGAGHLRSPHAHGARGDTQPSLAK